MGINRASGIGETSFPLHYARSKKYKTLSFARSLGLIVLSVIALMLMPDDGWSQQGGQSGWSQQGRQNGAQRLYARAKENPAAPAITATPTIEPTSPFGQALASCDKDAAAQETFALPGLTGERTLDHCYKVREQSTCAVGGVI